MNSRKDTILDSAWNTLEKEGMHITSVGLYHACNHEYTLKECEAWMRLVDDKLDALDALGTDTEDTVE